MSSGNSRFFGIFLSIGLAVTTVFAIAVALDQVRRVADPAAYVLMAAVFGGAYFVLMRGPLGRAIARMLDGSSVHDGALDRADEIDELMARSAEDRLRLLELEERLDFAERLLATQLRLPELERMDTPV